MGKPFISVVITAYNRREFIRDAVKSVIDSTLTEDGYELIVVKNFKDEYTDNIVKKLGGKNVFSDFISIGAKVALGVKAASGDVITFLEDDDMYTPRRLEVIRNEFKCESSLIYYHNNVLVIDELGKPRYDKLVEKTNIHEEVIVSTYKDKVDAFMSHGWNLGLRLSSMAVRRSFIMKWVDVIKLFPDLVDVLIFMLALTDKGVVLHDPRRLTYYRISGMSASSVRATRDPMTRFTRAVKNAARHTLARHMLVTLANHIGFSKHVKYDEATVIGGIYGGWGKWLSKALIDLIISCNSVTCIGSAMLGLIYMINPWLAKRLVYLYYMRAFAYGD
jgi:glycosyltransferase involved in cell wall biosynthesis